MLSELPARIHALHDDVDELLAAATPTASDATSPRGIAEARQHLAASKSYLEAAIVEAKQLVESLAGLHAAASAAPVKAKKTPAKK